MLLPRSTAAGLALLLLAAPALAEPDAGGTALFLAGDTLITQPWSTIAEPEFRAVIDTVQSADVAIVNLEMLIHEFGGYAQAQSGGAYSAAPPEIAHELAWAGIDMVGHANNHTFDYGSLGVLENLENVRKAGIVLAGSGEDLQAARAPRTFRHPSGSVALVSAASTFVPYGLASRSRPNLRGRPGLNPLRVISDPRFTLTRQTAERLYGLAQAFGFSGYRFGRRHFDIAGFDFRIGAANSIATGTRPNEADLEGNLAAVREAAASADLVVFSIHAHRQGEWLRALAHRIIDAGADVFLAHGPHEVRGIEIYAGRPIFYCLGDFSYQVEQIARHPTEVYEFFELGEEATSADVRAAKRGRFGAPVAPRKAFEAVGASVRFDAGQLSEIQLLPLDLRPDAPFATRGAPRRANPETGRRIIEEIAAMSRRYDTEVRYLDAQDLGVVSGDGF